MKYLDIKTKRIIQDDNGNVVGHLAYAMAEDYSHMVFAIAQKHPDDVQDLEFGKALATLRLKNKLNNSLETPTQRLVTVSYTDPEILGEVCTWGIKLESLILQTGLKYVKLGLLFQIAYQRYGICTNRYR